MVNVGKSNLSDAIRQLCRKAGGCKEDDLVSTREMAAEQVREAQESSEAYNAVASSRDRMADIYRGN